MKQVYLCLKVSKKSHTLPNIIIGISHVIKKAVCAQAGGCYNTQTGIYGNFSIIIRFGDIMH